MIIVEEDAMQDESCDLIKAELSHLKAKDKMMEDRINSLTKEKEEKDKENETLGRKVEALEEELEKTNQLVKKLKSNKSELRKRAESGAIVGSITVIVGYIVMQYDLPEEVRTAIIGLVVGIVTQITKYLHNLKKKDSIKEEA
jgi:predicted RNase H-like nuclease (RuvC/YqgF family)